MGIYRLEQVGLLCRQECQGVVEGCYGDRSGDDSVAKLPKAKLHGVSGAALTTW